MIEEVPPGAEGEDMGVGTQDDYYFDGGGYIGPESKPLPPDENDPQKKK